MECPQLAVAWESYQSNICNGLTTLQQRGEFVDMTLAADGHLVKVHRMVLCLVSPYIKNLIASVDCPHPVIFLNDISYEVLQAILQYIYTGEVIVSKENFKSFMTAGRALRIRGLDDVAVNEDTVKGDQINMNEYNNEVSENLNVVKESTGTESMDDTLINTDEGMHEPEANDGTKEPTLQYSLSNHGNLQLVLNRYVYNMKYYSRKSGNRSWKCVDGSGKEPRCRASVLTNNSRVVRRTGLHNHPFHDKKIIKKIQRGGTFTTLKAAQTEVQLRRHQTENKPMDNLK
ncbi:protein bric-a-brac 2-like isoform X1 [Bombyx mandarina]|uniref:Protein bric-a-brac 2-like isoform X1 n=2 Tax=Bombyx mandarina TaxID=7092 RepID=A0A6J2KCF3_BOMMA|nr:protein bric-a-brac 2-like isoform X1 [Bombyx mandarina]